MIGHLAPTCPEKKPPEAPRKTGQNPTRADTTCSAATVAGTGVKKKSTIENPSESTLTVTLKAKDQQKWLVVGRVRESQRER